MLSIRKIGVIGRTYRHLNRYRQILTILFKYGFGDLLEMLKIDQYIEVGLQLISKKREVRFERLTRPQGLRMAFEELGPTYIKLGQVLSTRPDLIPMEFIAELSKLQDHVPAFAFDQVRQVIESEFRRPAEELFDQLEAEPLGSASIGQVHRAVLKDGETVAVKLQRPGIRKIIEVDLEIMLHLATLAERHIEELAFHRPVKIVEEFAKTLENEIDYLNEATNMQRAARYFLDDPTVYIPKVFREATTSRVLTTEFIDGIKISNVEALEAAGLDRKEITRRGADLVLKQVFEHCFFHADPHPGNIFVLPDNVICLLDFGMAGMVDRHTRDEFVDLVESIVNRNEARASQVLLELTYHEQDPDRRQFERAVAEFMGRHLYKPLKDIELGKLLYQLLELSTSFRLRIPPDIFLMMKALGTVEGVGHMLDPEFDMFARAKPFIMRVKLERFKPERIADDMYEMGAHLLRFVRKFPDQLLEMANLIRQEKLRLQIEHRGLENMLATHDRISNRISFSILIAALIIGSALIVISETPPLVYGISLIGILLFFAAAIMGIWLLVAILKKGKL
jgi:ubiquinone biosynthesis protein